MGTIKFFTEYQNNPIGLHTSAPEFSWKYLSDCGRQNSYRVVVASAKDNIENNKYDMWDSGVVQSSDCFGVVYNGKALKSKQIYYVKLFLSCDKGTFTGGLSTFEMGLLHPGDWSGKWISVPGNFDGGTLLIRKRFGFDKEIQRARVYLCGIGYHELFVNGVKQGNAVLNPGQTAYGKRVLYCTYDVTDALVRGNNVIGAEVCYGWYGDRKILAEIFVEYTDGSTYGDHTSNGYGWWIGGSPTLRSSIYGGETYDAGIEDRYPVVWATDRYDPSWENGWMYPLLAEGPGGEIEAQTVEDIKVCDTYAPVGVTDIGGIKVYDIGQNIAGWARIRVRGKRGAVITLRFGEGLRDDGRVNQLNLRSAASMDVYILKGEGIEEWAPRFTYHGFQYVEAETEGDAEIVSLTGEHVHTDVRLAGSFCCDDGILNRLHKNAVITELNNLHSIMTDCPQRDERFGWLNDLGSRLYQTVYNCGMERFFPKFIKDIADTADKEGAIADTAPYFIGGRPADPVCIAYLLMAIDSYRYYGDKTPLITQYGGMRKWTEFLLSRSRDFIMDYYYYADWVAPVCFDDVSTDSIFISSAYLNWHLKKMKEIAEIAGNAGDAERYGNLSRLSDAALNEKYFNKEKMCYGSGTQAENSIAVSMGICPLKYRKKVAENICKDAVRHGHHCTCGNVGYRHFFYVMADYGYLDEVIDILRNPEYPGWGYMIAKGATTVWERWEAEMQNVMHSFDHPMFGSYDAVFYGYLAGINIAKDAVACDRIIISPVFTDRLNEVKGTFETLRGTIKSEWKRRDGKVTLNITIPPMTQATVNVCGTLCGKPFAKGTVLKTGSYSIEDAVIYNKETDDEENQG